MAACHPKLKTHPGAELFFSRFADGDWRGIVRPWLDAGAGRLERSIVVAPTRGQTQALKQRCLVEGVRLLGVEFLTPSLARKKRGVPGGLGRSLQLLVLRDRIAGRVALLAPDDPARGLWTSLGSDLEAALDDFEALLRAGFRAEDFPRPELRQVFSEMAAWVEGHGYALGPPHDAKEASDPPAETSPVADRLLIMAGGAEGWGDFYGLVALAWRCTSVRVAVAEPDFVGRGAADEEWVGAWETALGAEAAPVDAEDPEETCAGVAELWSGPGGSAERADILVGVSRSDEMEHVAAAVARLVAEGSEGIAVVFPGAGSAHARLVGLLEARHIPYADLIGVSGTPPIDIRIQRALADFYERGCRLEELLALWPLLESQNLVKLTLGKARAVCQELFDKVQSHSVAPQVEHLLASEKEDGKEVGRVAALLMPPWPDKLTAADALGRFAFASARLSVAEDPSGWSALREFAAKSTELLPVSALLETLRSFLPEKAPASNAPGKSVFARVTLTTCRRAAGVAWSHAIFTESNAGIWPVPREPSVWLGDGDRRDLDKRAGRVSLGLPSVDAQALLERRLYCAVARDTRVRVLFSAALFSEEEPEVRLGPNAWLERVMWAKELLRETPGEKEPFEGLATARRGAGTAEEGRTGDDWPTIWARRRLAEAPFDDFFLGNPGGARLARLSAKQIERGVIDPATLWFDAVLRVRRVDWHSFARARKKAIGETVHGVLAKALAGPPVEEGFTEFPSNAAAQAALATALAELRARWPADRYWDSFHRDVSWATRELLRRVFELPSAPFAAIEAPLPAGATIPVGRGRRAVVGGRMDLVLSDKPGWEGAQVEIVDFKTGGDSGLSAKRMAASGASLQLGVYLEAARSLGASGNVWMLKPGDKPTRIAMQDVEAACAKLSVIGDHLETGLYGARTANRTEFSHPFTWPLACAPIPAAVLDAKFAATFGTVAESDAEEAEEALDD
jgi:PD-(D/E)XK nuclease superfamily